MSHALLSRLYRAAVEGVLPFPLTRDAVSRWLSARPSVAPVHVLALGKAAPDMARGAVAALQDRGEACAGGVIVAAHRPTDEAVLPLRVGDHPLPDVGSLAAADVLASTIARVDAGDDILVLLSGGTSSLIAAPCAELTALEGHPADAQAQIAQAMDVMMAHGLAIHEMNAIRRRLMRWSAGRLATALAARGARHVHVMAISDVIGDQPAVIGSGPCSADPFTTEDVLAICDAHGLRSHFHPTLARALGLSGDSSVAIATPPPSHPAFARVSYEVIAGNIDAQRAVARAVEFEHDGPRSVRDVIFAEEPLEGDADGLGAAIVQVALRHARAHAEATLFIWGGEPTVRMHDDFVDEDDEDMLGDGWSTEAPLGGRMQALALAAALMLDAVVILDREADRITVLAGGTDGRDGPTDAAGAIVDARTAMDIRRAGREPERDQRMHSSYRSLDAAGALLRTGPSGTNVMDLVLVHVAARDSRER